MILTVCQRGGVGREATSVPGGAKNLSRTGKSSGRAHGEVAEAHLVAVGWQGVRPGEKTLRSLVGELQPSPSYLQHPRRGRVGGR